MNLMDLAQLASHLVTILGLPLAIFLYFAQRRKERDDEDRLVYESLASSYDGFLKLVLENSDLHLWTKQATSNLNDEQEERLLVLFELLGSVFERAYLLVWSPNMTPTQSRRWAAWENDMRDWCRREDFRSRMPYLLHGADPGFVAYINRIVAETARTGKKTERDANH